MAEWKKVIVSGSAGNLSTIQVDNLTSGQVVIGGGSGSILSTTAINGTGDIIATTGATGVSMTGSFTGSFVGDGSGLTGLSSASTLLVSASAYSGQPLTSGSVALTTQGLTINGTQNEVDATISGQTVTIGLPNDVTIGNNLIVTNDLTVNGTTTYINVTDLYVEDKFILVASGSATNGDGGIVIDRGTYESGNISFGYDSATGRWGYQDGLADGSNTIDPTSASGVSGSFAGIVFTEGAHGAVKPITGEFAVAGAIYTATDGTIYMYA
jgi:hypothetical protein